MPVELCRSAKRVSDRFQGKKEATVSGALPPLAARAAKCQRSHTRGLILQRASVARIENIIVCSWVSLAAGDYQDGWSDRWLIVFWTVC